MVEVTLEITQFCPNGCSYCSSNASREGKPLPFEDIKNFLLNIKKIDRINISGGEPLSHPEFYKILKFCEQFTDKVWVYTNAIRRLIYNSDIIDEIEVHANVCIISGRMHYIPKTPQQIPILKLVHQGRADNLPEQNITVSRNFWDEGHCDDCNHILLQTNGEVKKAPCKKSYS
jgi:molybdenum cofactor biosynthesis enzyme MoaA